MTASASAPSGLFRAWYIVAILLLLYAISCVDRYILALLVDPISAEFQISDSVQGLMLGAGFAIVYSFAGLPLAHLIDRGQRRLIVAAGAILWGLTTIASGFAQNLETLLICRTGVAIGEAVLSPAAVSLISDLFVREKRNLPVSMYVGVSQLMGVGSFIVSAAALDLATQMSPDLETAPWRLTLMIVGLPSIVLALLMIVTVKEPARMSGPKDVSSDASLQAFLKHFRQSWMLYVPTFLGVAIGAMLSYGQVAWLPSLLIRGYECTPAQAGYYLGMIGVPAGLGGAFLWPWIAKLISKHGSVSSLLLCLLAAGAIGNIAAIAATRASELPLLLLGFGIAVTALAGFAPMIPILIQTVAPGRMHARLVSISFMCSNLIGFVFGPLLVPVLAAPWGDDPRALGHGIATLALILAPIVAGCFLLGWRTARTPAFAHSHRSEEPVLATH